MVVVFAVQVFELVKLAELYYAGSHGMDIKGPAKGSRHTKAAKVPIHHPTFVLATSASSPPTRKGEDTYLALSLCVAHRPKAFSFSRPASSCP